MLNEIAIHLLEVVFGIFLVSVLVKALFGVSISEKIMKLLAKLRLKNGN